MNAHPDSILGTLKGPNRIISSNVPFVQCNLWRCYTSSRMCMLQIPAEPVQCMPTCRITGAKKYMGDRTCASGGGPCGCRSAAENSMSASATRATASAKYLDRISSASSYATQDSSAAPRCTFARDGSYRTAVSGALHTPTFLRDCCVSTVRSAIIRISMFAQQVVPTKIIIRRI